MTVKMRNEIAHLRLPRPIALVGLGISGEATLRLLLAAGVPRGDILTFDQKQKADFNDPQVLMIQKPQTLCVSPGISLKTPWLAKALSLGIRLTSEMEIAFSFLTSEKIIGITGSLGKSTTTALLGAGAKTIDPHVFYGGNLGVPLADYACDLISGRPVANYVILELSSYQLENFANLNSDLSVFTFLSPNHLERYQTLQEYYDTKLTLVEKTSQWVIVNRNGGDNTAQIHPLEKKYSRLQFSFVSRDNLPPKTTPRLVGSHNLDNLAVAFAVAEKWAWPEKALQAMLQFPGLSHRMENVGVFQDVLFINDSKATTMDSVLQAYKSIESSNTVHLLLGGRDKNLPWEQLSSLKTAARLKIYFFGECAEKAQKLSQLSGTIFGTLRDGLEALTSQVQARDVVLLSPGGTSLDEFKNFEDRGDFFKNWVLTKFKN